MCFNSTMSTIFSVIGLAAAYYVRRRVGNAQLSNAIVFFVLMEALQSVQAFVIADKLGDAKCREWGNRILTVLGYVHIQFQPYFTNQYMSALRGPMGKAAPGEEKIWDVVRRLCLMQSALGMLRLFLMPAWDAEGLDEQHRIFLENSADWLEGPSTCTYRGNLHLAWSLPLPRPTYFLGGLGVHSFMMFAPVLAVGGLGELDACLGLLGTGPLLASYLTSNPHEAASIWCFGSIIQVVVGVASSLSQKRAYEAKMRKERIEEAKEPAKPIKAA